MGGFYACAISTNIVNPVQTVTLDDDQALQEYFKNLQSL